MMTSIKKIAYIVLTTFCGHAMATAYYYPIPDKILEPEKYKLSYVKTTTAQAAKLMKKHRGEESSIFTATPVEPGDPHYPERWQQYSQNSRHNSTLKINQWRYLDHTELSPELLATADSDVFASNTAGGYSLNDELNKNYYLTATRVGLGFAHIDEDPHID